MESPKANASNFHSSGLRQKVDQLMDILWAGGVNNPMDSIEQISYLLFLRLLTEKDETLAALDRKYTRIFSGSWARFTTGFGGTYPGALFDIIFANPPFAGKVQDESILADLNFKLNTRATELLFLKWIIDHLAPGGRAGVIVPNGVLFGSTNAATGLRELLLTECDLQAVISLTSGVFKPYAGVATAALIFEKVGRASPRAASAPTATRSVWFYDITADGFSLDDKRTPIEANDIPDALAKGPAREEGPNSYRVPIEKIRENDWSLAAGRYKPVIAETVHHDAPVDILNDVLKLENEIIRRGQVLLAALAPSDGDGRSSSLPSGTDRAGGDRIFPSQSGHIEPLNREGPPRPRCGGEGRGEGERFVGREAPPASKGKRA